MYSKLYYISQGIDAATQVTNIQKALDAGCTWIQLRYKQGTFAEVLVLAEQVKILCARYGATLVINDYLEIAKAIDADGLHLGLKDMPVREARAALDADKIIGGTANTLEDIRQRVAEGCNYVGLGPLRFTATKEKLSPILGFEGYQTILEKLNEEGITIPIYAIGGIEENDILPLMDIGLYGVAVSGLITHHAEPKKLIEQINYLVYANA